MRIKFISPARIGELECDLISVRSGKVTVKTETRQYTFNVSECDFWPVNEEKSKEESQAIKEVRELAEPTKQQPTVPIQFVWHDEILYQPDQIKGKYLAGKSCEQIGAVLYVRGE